MKRLELFFTAILVPVDALSVIAGLLAAYFLRSEGRITMSNWPIHDYILFVVYSLPIWLSVFAILHLYQIKPKRRGFEELSAIIMAILFAWALCVVILYFYRTEQTKTLPRKILIYAPFFVFFFTIVFRSIHHFIQSILYRYNIGIRKVLLIGKDDLVTSALVSAIHRNSSLGMKIINSINPDKISILENYFHHYHFDDIILAHSTMEERKVLDIIRFCEDKNIVFRQIPNVYDVQSIHLRSITIGGIPLIEFTYTNLEGWGHIVKRTIDLVGCLIALIILAIPMLIIALIIKLDSRGPVFYRHERIGRDGKLFNLLKFRTMKHEYCRGKNYGGEKAEKYFDSLMSNPDLKAEFEQDYKLKNDPRITNFGHFLRKTSLDELPQFINVLFGELSLVGPRPIVKGEMDKYGIFQNKRHIIRPGITGLWQISGRNDIPYEERIKLDLFYIHNWSLWMDIGILIKTLISLVKKNTY